MIGHLGRIQKIRALAKEQRAEFPLSGELSGEEQKRLDELNQQYWKNFQDQSFYQMNIWRAWSQFLTMQLEYIPKILKYLSDKETVNALGDDIYLKTQNWILRSVVWDFFRENETDWTMREFLLREYSELAYYEDEFMARQFSPEQNLAREYYKELAPQERLFDSEELREKVQFILKHYPGDDAKSALIILMRDSALDVNLFINMGA